MQTAKEKWGCNGVLVLLSGAFVQRGEPAVTDKWTRAEIALRGGADVVLELNSTYALAPAYRFAQGAIALLEKTNIVTDLCFGAETADLERLLALADSMDEETLRASLRAGKSWAEAASDAHAQLLTPNDILAIEYLRALQKAGSSIAAHVLPRRNSHTETDIGTYTSAQAIRQALQNGQDVSRALPYPDLLQTALAKQGGIATLENLAPLLFYRLRLMENDLSNLPEIGKEGLDNRILTAFRTENTFEDALQSAKTRRYTMARIKRSLCQLLLNRTQETEEKQTEPDHLRLLGFRKSAAPILRKLQTEAALPLVTKVAQAEPTPQLTGDIAAQNLWALSTPIRQKQNMDYTTSPVVLDL